MKKKLLKNAAYFGGIQIFFMVSVAVSTWCWYWGLPRCTANQELAYNRAMQLRETATNAVDQMATAKLETPCLTSNERRESFLPTLTQEWRTDAKRVMTVALLYCWLIALLAAILTLLIHGAIQIIRFVSRRLVYRKSQLVEEI